MTYAKLMGALSFYYHVHSHEIGASPIRWPLGMDVFVHAHPSGSGISPGDVSTAGIIGSRIISAGTDTDRYGSFSPGGVAITCDLPIRP